MRQLGIAIAVTALIAFAGPLPAFAQSASDMNENLDALFGEHEIYQKFFDGLKQAVATDDKSAVAAMVDYPFQARINDKAVKIRDAAHFVADYDRVITAKVRQAVAQQTYPTLFANWQGVSIGDGEVWFSGIGDSSQVKITAIND